MQEVAASSEEQSASTEEIAAAANTLAAAAERLSRLVAGLRVGEPVTTGVTGEHRSARPGAGDQAGVSGSQVVVGTSNSLIAPPVPRGLSASPV
jgi:hypothetical protein